MILDLLSQSIGGDTIKQISREIDADERKTEEASSAALPLLLGALARNSGRRAGAESLSNALERDHDGSVLDDMGGLLSNPSAGNGSGILKHILGGKQQRIESSLSSSTGLDPAAIGRLLQILAPLVMGALGQAKRKQNLDPSELSGMLNGEMRKAERQGIPTQGIMSLLDTDNDGDVSDDIIKIGGGLLGKFFR